MYRFDAALYEAIIATPVEGDIPHEILFRLPEWAVYIETPGMAWKGGPLYGFFAHLESDANTGGTELRLLLDAEEALLPVPLHLGPWSLAEAIARAVDVSNVSALSIGLPLAGGGERGLIRSWVEPLVSLLLYLCSQNAEIGDGSRFPANPEPKRTKQGWRMFPADRPTTWDVGVRLGAALRRAYRAAETTQGAPHTGPRAHIRHAHWHGFRSGPMTRADGTKIPAAERAFAVRWLPPIPLNVGDLDDLPTTIRPVQP